MTHRQRRRLLAAAGAGLALGATGTRAFAQGAGGGKPLRIVVPFPAGGSTDAIARLIGDKLRGGVAPAVLVENRVGASGRIGVEAVKNADPDGTTLVFSPDFLFTVYPSSFRKLSYDPVADFAPVAICSRSMLALCAGPGLPANIRTIADLLPWAKANPRLASFATTSPGGTPHFVGVMLSRAAQTELTAVHYKGGAPALQDLLGGQIPLSVNPVGEVLPHLRAGKIRALAVTGARRSRFVPDVPTMVEAGYPDVVVESWLGFLAPGRTPPDVVNRLATAIAEASASSDVQSAYEKFGVDGATSTPASFAATLKSDIARWAPVVKASGFTAED
jgi:tripartite-type tricarboxylate transporter receptor subunit TctC